MKGPAPDREGQAAGLVSGCEGCAAVATALAGGHPWLIAALPHSVLLLGDHQVYGGYAVLWSRVHAKELHHLNDEDYAGLMADLKRASRAVERATDCLKLNVVSLGNVVQHAHFHLFPRSAEDPQRLRHPWVHEDRFKEAGSDELRRRWVRAIQELL
jgi:diadenosine tetraphosphate (Ap4A) HIT family hydrolase